MIKAYDQAESWQTKAKLKPDPPLFANDFSGRELQTLIPGITKWRIDQARQHTTEAGKGQVVPEQTIFRKRIDQGKVDHFISYILQPQLHQDVAFATKTLKLDSGERIVIPAVVRTLIPSRIIEQYTSYCREQHFEPASTRSLFRMLEICSASMQRSLMGLITSQRKGTEAFDNLRAIIDTLVENGEEGHWAEIMRRDLKEAKRYLKTDYKTRASRNEKNSDHCTVHALSDLENPDFCEECPHPHDIHCDRCDSLDSNFRDILKKIDDRVISDETRARIDFENKECSRAVQAWKAHLLRSVNQEEAKQNALTQLGEETCLIIMDWAMKYLPQHYREQMSEFFDKRGRSWHISAVITRSQEEGKCEVECFVHLFNTCKQNSFAVMSVIEYLLNTIKIEYPSINKAFLRSDNAGCYHSGPLILSLPYIGTRSGVIPLRYDFSDTQTGKDICDRKTAPMKVHIKRWVNEKHDMTTAENMKEVLESHGGLKGCRVAVVQVDTTKSVGVENKIPGISLLNNFLFEERGCRAWKAYKVGPGCFIPYDKVIIERQGDTGLKVIQPFGARTKERGTIAENTRPLTEIFPCTETGCVLSFKTLEEVEQHMDSGKHVRELESESLYDSIRKKWAERLTGVNVAVFHETGTYSAEELDFSYPSLSKKDQQPMGWALKTVKKPSRMEAHVKAYLVQKFDTGCRTGQKADPVQVAREMKIVKDYAGHLLFTPQEWITAQQINSFFSRLSAVQRQTQMEKDTSEYATSQEFTEEDPDLEVLENETVLENLRIAINLQVTAPQHPIVVRNRNLCELSKAKKLDVLKVAELREMCESLQFEVSG